MSHYDVLNELQSHMNSSPYATRILCELNYASTLSNALGDKYADQVASAMDYIARAVSKDGVITKAAALAAEELLLPLQADAKKYRVHSIAHAHIDMNWMWGYQETASLTVDTFRTVLDLMKEYPQLTFGQSQASTYEIIEKFAPEMLDEIKARVHEGRWEVTASTWVETDKNMASAESLARHILYTRRYLSKLLDIPAASMNLDFEPDTFGHNISVPDICAAGGVKYYYHCRGNADTSNVYRWVGRGGGELLVWREAHWYNTTIEPNMFWDTAIICERDGVDCLMNVYGVGDHGGGPTRRDINRLTDMASWPIMPTILFSTYKAFFEDLEQYRDSLPVREGELNFLFDGCYTSQAKIKMTNRISEARAYEAEVLDTEAYMVSGKAAHHAFTEAWHNILFNQFHDILPGSGVPHTREHALGRFQDAMAYITTAGNTAMRRIAGEIDTTDVPLQADPNSISEGGGVGKGVSPENYYRMPATDRGMGKLRLLHFFNPTQYDFEGVTEFLVYDWHYDVELAIFKDLNGNIVPHKLLEVGNWYWGHSFLKFALAVKVPAFGYASYTLDTRPATAPGLPPLFAERTDDYTGDDIVLENDLIRAVFDHRTAQLTSLVDKASGKELVNSPACTFNLITENTIRNMTSWRVGDYMSIRPLNETCELRVHDIRCDGIRKWFRYHFSFTDRSRMEVLVTLDEGSSRLDFDVTVDFHEIGNHMRGVPQLSFGLPLGYASKACRFDVPFGTIDRAPLDYDVPASSFGVPLSEDGPSLMLISDSKHGFRYTKEQLSLALIRASFDPDPYPEYGIHRIRLSVGVCHPEAGSEGLYRMAEAFVHPISYCTADLQKREGRLPPDGRFLTVKGSVKVTAVKKAEDRDALVVRFSNVEEGDTDYRLTFRGPVKAAYLTDINENILSALPCDSSDVCGKACGHELLTIMVELA